MIKYNLEILFLFEKLYLKVVRNYILGNHDIWFHAIYGYDQQRDDELRYEGWSFI